MNKAILLFLFAISVIEINSEFDLCPESLGSNDRDDDDDNGEFCRIHSTNRDYTHCCYLRATTQSGNEIRRCIEINDDAYENIKRYKNFLKNTLSDVKIKCSSEFLTYSLFALLVLLF